jgi:hypothetical protein
MQFHKQIDFLGGGLGLGQVRPSFNFRICELTPCVVNLRKPLPKVTKPNGARGLFCEFLRLLPSLLPNLF